MFAATPSTRSDARLIERVAEGDPRAFAALYDRHAVAAYSLARSMLGAERAEDAVQEAFLALWRGASRYRPGRGPLRPWLLRIVRNRCLDALRRDGTHKRRRLEVPDLESRLAADARIIDEVVATEQSSRVAAALRRLPDAQRAVIEMAYFEGLSHTEIAGRLGIPLGTVKGRTRLAMQRLGTALAGERPVAV